MTLNGNNAELPSWKALPSGVGRFLSTPTLASVALLLVIAAVLVILRRPDQLTHP